MYLRGGHPLAKIRPSGERGGFTGGSGVVAPGSNDRRAVRCPLGSMTANWRGARMIDPRIDQTGRWWNRAGPRDGLGYNRHSSGSGRPRRAGRGRCRLCRVARGNRLVPRPTQRLRELNREVRRRRGNRCSGDCDCGVRIGNGCPQRLDGGGREEKNAAQTETAVPTPPTIHIIGFRLGCPLAALAAAKS